MTNEVDRWFHQPGRVTFYKNYSVYFMQITQNQVDEIICHFLLLKLWFTSTSSHIWKLGFQGNINPLSLANYANYKMIYMPDWLIEMSEDCPNYQKLLLVSLSIRRWYLQVFLKMTITWFQKVLTTMLLTRNFFILFSRELLELFRGGFTQSTYKHLILIF